MVLERFQAYVRPVLGHKDSKRKKKSVGNHGHFWVQVLNPNRKGFPFGINFDLDYVQNYIGPFWGEVTRKRKKIHGSLIPTLL